MVPAPLPEELLKRADLWTGAQQAAVAAEASGFAALDTRLPGGGWPRGALSELIVDEAVHAELAIAAPLLSRITQQGRHAALVAPPQIPYAPALQRAGVDLARLWVVEPGTDADTIWAMEQLLRTPSCGLALGWARRADERAQRRLQLAAEHSGAVALLARPAAAASGASVAALRLQLSPEPSGRLGVALLKVRGGRAGQHFTLETAA